MGQETGLREGGQEIEWPKWYAVYTNVTTAIIQHVAVVQPCWYNNRCNSLHTVELLWAGHGLVTIVGGACTVWVGDYCGRGMYSMGW